MTVLERIKALCREKKNISITTLEQMLGYSNGSLAKAKDIPGSRIAEIATFLEVSTDYIMLGRETEFSIEMAQKDVALSNMDEHLKTYMLKLAELDKAKQDAIFALIDTYEKKGE